LLEPIEANRLLPDLRHEPKSPPANDAPVDAGGTVVPISRLSELFEVHSSPHRNRREIFGQGNMFHAAVRLASLPMNLAIAEGLKCGNQDVIETVDRHGSAGIRPEYPIVQAGDVHLEEVHRLSVLIGSRE
jgi:hypothetical protein